MSAIGISAFESYNGIDYPGEQTPRSSLKGLRVYMADGMLDVSRQLVSRTRDFQRSFAVRGWSSNWKCGLRCRSETSLDSDKARLRA
jgi:hypothetical protein